MRTIPRLPILLLACLGLATASAEVEPLNHELSPGQSYTVPEGHAVLLEIVISNTATGAVAIQLPGASFAFFFNTSPTLQAGSIERGLLLKEGTIISAPAGGGIKYLLLGRLVTKTELYAKAEHSQEVQTASGRAQLLVQSDSKRPIRFRLEDSDDLQTWTEAGGKITGTSRSGMTADLGELATVERNFARVRPREIPTD